MAKYMTETMRLVESYRKVHSAVNEEIDLGWDIEARRDDRNRDINDRREFDGETIVVNGQPERRDTAIRRVRAMVSTLEDKYPDRIVCGAKPIEKIRNAKSGEPITINMDDYFMTREEYDAYNRKFDAEWNGWDSEG